MVDCAWSTLTVKAVDHEQRAIEGIASTPSVDRVGDIVEPMGAKFTLPMPLLHHHKHDQPVGHVVYAKATPNGIPITAQLARVVEPGALKDRIDTAWHEIKSGLVRGLSIGFKPLDAEPIDPKEPWGGLRFKSWDWLELSLVTVPANSEASISVIKSLDRGGQATPSQTRTLTGESLLSHRIAERLKGWCPNSPLPRYSREAWAEIFEAEDAAAAKQVAAEAKSLGIDRLRRENADLRQRLAQLERRLSKVVNARGDLSEYLLAVMGNVVGHVRGEIADLSKAIRARVEALEQRPAGLQYRGVWSESVTYPADSLVTHGGSGWVAMTESKGLRPGEGAAWKLAIKGDLAELRREVRAEVAKQVKGKEGRSLKSRCWSIRSIIRRR